MGLFDKAVVIDPPATQKMVSNHVEYAQHEIEERLHNYLEGRFMGFNASIDRLEKRCNTLREGDGLIMRDMQEADERILDQLQERTQDLGYNDRINQLSKRVVNLERTPTPNYGYLLDLITRQERFIDELRKELEGLKLAQLAQEGENEMVGFMAEMKILNDFRLPEPTFDPVDHMTSVWEIVKGVSEYTGTGQPPGVQCSNSVVPELFRSYVEAVGYVLAQAEDVTQAWTDPPMFQHRGPGPVATTHYYLKQRSLA